MVEGELVSLREKNKKLRLLGFVEAKKKQFLFLKTLRQTHNDREYKIIFFADLRAKNYPYRTLPFCWAYDPLTEELGSKGAPDWILNRIERTMLMEMEEAGIETDEHDYFSEYLAAIEDGFCKKCRLDFKDNGLHCVDCAIDVKKENAEKAKKRLEKEIVTLRVMYEALIPSCQFCNVKLTDKSWLMNKFREHEIGPISEMIPHHIRYGTPEITMTVCRSCHAKIELGSDPAYTKYRAIDKRPTNRRKTKDVRCGTCGKRCRVELDFPKGELHNCYTCRRKKNTQMKTVKRKTRSYSSRTAWAVRAFRAK